MELRNRALHHIVAQVATLRRKWTPMWPHHCKYQAYALTRHGQPTKGLQTFTRVPHSARQKVRGKRRQRLILRQAMLLCCLHAHNLSHQHRSLRSIRDNRLHS